MDEATNEQLDPIFELAERFARMRGRNVTDVMLALLYSNTLRSFGYDGSGHLTSDQAKACVGILESWIAKAGDMA